MNVLAGGESSSDFRCLLEAVSVATCARHFIMNSGRNKQPCSRSDWAQQVCPGLCGAVCFWQIESFGFVKLSSRKADT